MNLQLNENISDPCFQFTIKSTAGPRNITSNKQVTKCQNVTGTQQKQEQGTGLNGLIFHLGRPNKPDNRASKPQISWYNYPRSTVSTRQANGPMLMLCCVQPVSDTVGRRMPISPIGSISHMFDGSFQCDFKTIAHTCDMYLTVINNCIILYYTFKELPYQNSLNRSFFAKYTLTINKYGSIKKINFINAF